jgi:hypothetical protein
MDSVEQPKQQKMDMRFGKTGMSGVYRSGSLNTIISREFAKYKLDLVGVQEVRWGKGDTEQADDYTFFYGNWNADHQLRTGFFCTYVRG